jgi:hypothetical protein
MSGKVNEYQVDSILDQVWKAAAREQPMLLATLRTDYAFSHLRAMITDCLDKGLVVEKVIEHTVTELLRTARTRAQPSETCETAEIRN